MEHKEYNGWWNYETWCVNLWLTNERDSYDIISDLAMDYTNASEIGEYEFSKRLRDYVEDMNPLADDASLFSDLLGAALSECNWQEIAEHWLDDYREDHPTEPTEYTISLNAKGYHVDGNSILGWTELTFWEAFNSIIDDAHTDGSSSVVVCWELDPKDREQDQVNALIKRQHSRNTPAIKCEVCKGTGGDVPYTGADCPICGGSGWESNLDQ